MPNETIAAVPANVNEPVVLKRFLDRLIERLDIVLGLRGDSGYITATDLEQGLSTIGTSEEVEALAASLAEVEESNSALANSITQNADAISGVETRLSSVELDSNFHDFNYAGYEDLDGRYEFDTIGVNIANAPYTPAGGEQHYNFLDCYKTATGGVIQVLRAYSDTTVTPATYTRIGRTWSDALARGWY